MDKKKRISIFYFLAVFIIYFSLDFRMIKMPFVFAEDAIFLNEAITDGFKSIIYRHAGYFELLPRLFANIAVFIGAIFNSYFCVTKILQFLTVLFESYFIVYFAIGDYEWLCKKRNVRFLLSTLFLLWMSNFYSNVFTSAYLHWFAEIYVFLVGLNYIKGKSPGIFDKIIMGIVLLNSPEASIVLLPLIIYEIWDWKKDNKHIRKIESIKEKSYLGAYLLIAVFQIVLLKTGGFSDDLKSIASNSLLNIVGSTIKMTVRTPVLLLSNQVCSLFGLKICLFLGIIIWAGFLYVAFYLKIWKEFFYLLYFVVTHFFLASVKFDWSNASMNNWEYSMPCIATMIYMIFIISTLVSKKMFVKEFKWAFTIIVMVVCFSQCEGIMRMGYVSEDYIRYDSYYSILQPFDELEKKVDFSSDTYEVVNDDIWNWRYYVPVEE